MNEQIELLDRHCHLLPQLDDGPTTVCESDRMVESMWVQGVRGLWLTPHFYAHQETVSAFLRRRDRSYRQFRKVLEKFPPFADGHFPVRLGAEVYLSPALPQVKELDLLAVEGADSLLLEMPWTDQPPEAVYRAVKDLNDRFSGQVILAHIERYDYFYDEEWLEAFSGLGLEFQCNLEIVYYPDFKREQIYKYMKKGSIAHLGSDAHNMGHRPPIIGEPLQMLRAALGQRRVVEMASGLFSEVP